MDSGHPPTVLIVEDERELADIYRRWLEDDYQVLTAYTGNDGLEMMDESVDVVLLDRRLPGMTGGEVLNEIRETGFDCRIAMITAVDPDFDIIDMPFDDYVVKPVLKEGLRDIVARLLKLATYNDQVQESFRVASKLVVLDQKMTKERLAQSTEYMELRNQFEELRSHINGSLEEFENEDFELAYRDLTQR